MCPKAWCHAGQGLGGAASDQNRLQRRGVSSWMGRGREPRPAKSLNSVAAPGARVLGFACGPAIAPSGVSPAQNRLPSHDPSKHQALETDVVVK